MAMTTSQVCAVAEKISCLSSLDAHTAALPDSSLENGVVKSFNKAKGYGFVRIQSQVVDVYFKTEDFTPRSKQRAQQIFSITGAPITCAPEDFGRGRARARSVKLLDDTKQLDVEDTEAETPQAAVLEEPSLKVCPSISKAALVRTSVKKAAPTRPRGWGVPSSEESSSQKAQLMSMGFTEEAANDALSSGLDFNTVLDSLLSSVDLPGLATRRASSDSLETAGSASELTTQAGSDDSSDNSSSAADKSPSSPEAISLEPDMDITSFEAECELPLGVDTVLPVASEQLDLPLDLSAALETCAEASPAEATHVAPKASEMVARPARQLARVMRSLPEGCSAANPNLLAVQPGTLIYVWADSATEHGWIYAERLDKGSLAGWIPADLLKILSPSLELRSAVKNCPSFSDLHLAAGQGDIVLVDIESVEQAAEGAWIEAERLDGTQSGWFPTCALGEISSKLRWLRAAKSQEALHNSQASMEEGDLLLVDLETRTEEGWAYAWAADRHRSSVQAGWVPVNCLEWPVQA